MAYQAVIFDLDGTLIDSLTDIGEAANRTLADMGMPSHPISAYRTFIGDGAQTLVARILPEVSRKDQIIQNTLQRFKEDYSQHWHVHTCLYDGIAEMLTALHTAGIPLSILSNKPHEFTKVCADHFLTAWKFHPVLGQRPGIAKKPDAAGADEIAGTLEMSPCEILFVGDSGADMQTAVNAGMDGAGALWGFRTAEELLASGAKHLVDQPSDLLEIVLSKP